jgi:hypothetical protein
VGFERELFVEMGGGEGRCVDDDGECEQLLDSCCVALLFLVVLC